MSRFLYAPGFQVYQSPYGPEFLPNNNHQPVDTHVRIGSGTQNEHVSVYLADGGGFPNDIYLQLGTPAFLSQTDAYLLNYNRPPAGIRALELQDDHAYVLGFVQTGLYNVEWYVYDDLSWVKFAFQSEPLVHPLIDVPRTYGLPTDAFYTLPLRLGQPRPKWEPQALPAAYLIEPFTSAPSSTRNSLVAQPLPVTLRDTTVRRPWLRRTFDLLPTGRSSDSFASAQQGPLLKSVQILRRFAQYLLLVDLDTHQTRVLWDADVLSYLGVTLEYTPNLHRDRNTIEFIQLPNKNATPPATGPQWLRVPTHPTVPQTFFTAFDSVTPYCTDAFYPLRTRTHDGAGNGNSAGFSLDEKIHDLNARIPPELANAFGANGRQMFPLVDVSAASPPATPNIPSPLLPNQTLRAAFGEVPFQLRVLRELPVSEARRLEPSESSAVIDQHTRTPYSFLEFALPPQPVGSQTPPTTFTPRPP